MAATEAIAWKPRSSFWNRVTPLNWIIKFSVIDIICIYNNDLFTCNGILDIGIDGV